jgi:hypothetical protein
MAGACSHVKRSGPRRGRVTPVCLTHSYLSGYALINDQQVIDRESRMLTMRLQNTIDLALYPRTRATMILNKSNAQNTPRKMVDSWINFGQ